MPEPTRVIVPIDDSKPEALGTSLGYAKMVAQRATPRTDNIILLTHTKQQLRSTSLERHLGVQASKALAANKAVGIGDGFLLQHETMQTLRFGARNSVIIAFYADEKAKTWGERWTPHIHGQTPQAPVTLLSDPVIENALRTLSRMANLAHGVMHPRDKQHADEILRILRAKGHSAPVGDIKSWAIREGWKPEAADELARLASKIFGLKNKPNLGALHDPNGRYARWKDGDE